MRSSCNQGPTYLCLSSKFIVFGTFLEAPFHLFGFFRSGFGQIIEVYAQKGYASKGYASKGYASKQYALKGLCLKTVCLKGNMPQDGMPKRDMPHDCMPNYWTATKPTQSCRFIDV